ncbi:hypothetical protein [Chlorobium sp. KB01]|nr:hypothetical protein [Chlorobium sp. KB01]
MTATPLFTCLGLPWKCMDCDIRSGITEAPEERYIGSPRRQSGVGRRKG